MTFIPDADIEALLVQYAETVDVTRAPEAWDDAYQGFYYTAHHAVSDGFRVVPLMHGTKRPEMSDWTRAATQDDATLRGWAHAARDGWGIGLIPTATAVGHRRVVLDADTDTAYVFLRHHLGAPDVVTAGRYSGAHKGGAHWYVAVRAPIAGLTSKSAAAYGIDIFGADGTEGHQAVGAGSWVAAHGAYYHSTHAAAGESRAALAYLRARRDAPLDVRAPELWRWLLALVPAPPKPRPAPAADRCTENLDEWSRDTTWADLLVPDGWTRTGTDRCGCDVWQHPWDASTPRSATAHEDGCAESQSGLPGGALRAWSGRVAAIMGWASISKLAYVAHARHDGDYTAAREAEGIPDDRHNGAFDPADYI